MDLEINNCCGTTCDKQAVIAEIKALRNQNAGLVAQVVRLNNFSNDRIARAATLRSCIEKVLGCEELVFNSDVVLVVSSELADDIRCALDATPAQCLLEVKADAVDSANSDELFHIIKSYGSKDCAYMVSEWLDQYANKIRGGKNP